METKKVIFNRPIISCEEINQRQDFDAILKQFETVKPNLYKKILFYGSIGLSCFLGSYMLLSSSSKNNSKKHNYEKINTLKSNLINNDSNIIAEPLSRIKTVVLNTDKNRVIVKTDLKLNSINTISSISDQEFLETTKSDFLSGFTMFPSISGVENGKISLQQFLNANKIDAPSGYNILGYTLNFFKISDFVSIEVNGNEIPNSLKEELLEYYSGLPISFTNIEMENKKGNESNVANMRLFIGQ